MDSISLLVGPPPNGNRALTQDDFDARYNFVKFRKKKTNGELVRQYTIGENWQLYQPPNSWAQLLPITMWIQKYHVKDSLWRDLLGALFLSALLIPQSISYGAIIDNIPVAVFSLYFPQIIYAFFGSAQHSSLGSLSFTSIMIYSSVVHSKSTFGAITLCCAVIQLLQFLLPLEFIFSYISTSSLSGFSLGLFLRIVARLFSQFLVFRGHDCKPTAIAIANATILPANATMSRPLQCFYAAMPCLRAADPLLIGVSVAAVCLFIVFKWRVTRWLISRCGFSAPHEFVILLIATMLMLFLGNIFGAGGVEAAPPRAPLDFSIPEIRFWKLPSSATWLDSFAIAMYTMTAHMSITKSIAVEKMYKVHRKQELLCFSLISFTSSLFGLLPPSSGYGSSQLNIESSKFSLVANVFSLIPTTLVIQFGAPLFNVLPMCAVGVMVITSLSGWFSDLKSIRETFYASTWDAGLALCALLSALIFPNTCSGFLAMLACQIFAVSLRVQFPTIEVLSKLSDAHFAEETRYEGGDCLDTPMRIIRLGGPLLSVNCESVRNEMCKQAVIVKGLIGIGIGTRTASLRSQCPSAVGPKFSLQESVTARESFGLSANITIIQECDVSVTLPPGDEPPPIVRFLVLTFNGVNAIDKDMCTCLSQIYGDLNADNIKCLFSGVPALIRDQMEHLGLFNTIPRTSLFPNIQEAMICARNTVAPFHMSVSMNGYRDVIALSCAQSNVDLNRASPEAV